MNAALPPPSAETRVALKWGYRDALVECGDAIASLGISIAEAASRGSDNIIALHVRQARLVVIEALAAVKDLEALDASELDR